ncbi:MAG: polysaccharide export protein [Desulfuromonas sp.]|nr:polysaccharide export protein [Desulfuromonas sp.]
MRLLLLIPVLLGFAATALCAVPAASGASPSPRPALTIDVPAPFGAELFQGNFAKGVFDELNPEYVIMPGDRVAVRVWGARTFDGVFEVDAQGIMFLPEIGPVQVGGAKHSQLTDVVRKKIGSVYISNVEVYTNLISTQPVAVYVTGFVPKPGRYAGGPTESVLYYLDMAGGIDAERGSYRDIRIMRDGKLLAQIDLYPFILQGKIARPRLEEGDVILVGERGLGVVTEGNVRHNARFEFLAGNLVTGQQLVELTSPEQKVSHVSVVGSRHGAPYNIYLPVADFQQIALQDGDIVHFHADTPGDTMMISATGAIIGASRYPVKKDTRLKSLLSFIPVEPELANLEGIHIKRRSVAERQRKSLDEALRRLEYSSLTATSQSVDEANIRVREAELISQFVAKAREAQPDGTLVVGQGAKLNDLYLEDGDIIVIPAKSDVVMISGEVLMPQAIVFRPGQEAADYVAGAGGFSDRADKGSLLVVKPNGEVLPADDTRIAAGDQLLVMPRFDTKNLQLLKDISQILYQIAIATKVVIDL